MYVVYVSRENIDITDAKHQVRRAKELLPKSSFGNFGTLRMSCLSDLLATFWFPSSAANLLLLKSSKTFKKGLNYWSAFS